MGNCRAWRPKPITPKNGERPALGLDGPTRPLPAGSGPPPARGPSVTLKRFPFGRGRLSADRDPKAVRVSDAGHPPRRSGRRVSSRSGTCAYQPTVHAFELPHGDGSHREVHMVDRVSRSVPGVEDGPPRVPVQFEVAVRFGVLQLDPEPASPGAGVPTRRDLEPEGPSVKPQRTFEIGYSETHLLEFHLSSPDSPREDVVRPRGGIWVPVVDLVARARWGENRGKPVPGVPATSGLPQETCPILAGGPVTDPMPTDPRILPSQGVDVRGVATRLEPFEHLGIVRVLGT